MNWKELLTSKRFVSSLAVVIVSVASLFGVTLDEAQLTEAMAQVVRLLATVGVLGGGGLAAWVARENRKE